MMYARKNPLAANVRTAVREVPLTEENGAAALGHGFAGREGRLFAGYGAADAGLSLPAGETAAALFGADGAAGRAFALVCVSGKVYFRAAGAQSFADSGVTFAKVPAAARLCGDENGVLLSDGQKTALLQESGVAEETEIPAFVCAAYHYERLWLVPAANAGRLCFSAPGDARDFTAAIGGGGYIDLPDEKGDIVALVACETYLYVFRERGLQRLYARGDESEFELRDEFSCAKIYAETVCETGGKLYWLAEDGLHLFDGGNLENFAENCRIFANEQNVPRAVAAGGAYALHARLNTEEGAEEGFVIIDPLREDRQIVWAEASAVSACGSDVYFVKDGAAYVLQKGGAPARRIVRELENPLGAAGRLAEVTLYGKGIYVIKFLSEKGERIVHLQAVGGRAKSVVNLAGERFVCELISEGAACELCGLTVRYIAGRQT